MPVVYVHTQVMDMAQRLLSQLFPTPPLHLKSPALGLGMGLTYNRFNFPEFNVALVQHWRRIDLRNFITECLTLYNAGTCIS